jgi:hypothetical protein
MKGKTQVSRMGLSLLKNFRTTPKVATSYSLYLKYVINVSKGAKSEFKSNVAKFNLNLNSKVRKYIL